ncbi:MAG: sulfatase-like hydrolase/transferase, partial [Planctomycetota bacterium]
MKYTLCTLTFAAACILSLEAHAAPRPNILYFYVDDMGWGSVAPNGQAARKAAGKPFVRTPNLDRLAAAGINFARAYGCTVCSPARSSQQTGFHQGHTFADRNDPNNAKKAMRAEDVCMGEALAAAGYVTGYWGKWGYGGSSSKKDPTIDNVQTLPTSHGYKYVLAELHHVRAHTFFQPTLWSAPARAGAVGGMELVPNSMKPYVGRPGYPRYPSNHNHAGYPATAYCDDSYAFAALDFVRKGALNYNKTKQPFFGLFAPQIPHAPFAEIAKLPEWDKAYAGDPHFAKLAAQSRQWAAMVTRIDAHFGNILAALEDPNGDGNRSDSVADKTLVVFQSDNGGPGGSSCKEYDANGGLRGNKGSIYEGGIRVPTIMRLPSAFADKSRLKAGTNSDMVIDVSDLLPTFCELAGRAPPVGVDGVSLAPTLTGTGRQRKREYLIHEAGSNASIIRGRYKLVMNRGGGGGRKKAGRGKKRKKSGETAASSGVTLYDLVDDHGEAKNIAAKNPELAAELKSLLLAEHVTQAPGFANTYHHWTGRDGADIAEAGNWSDYVYKNAGQTYTTDDGA